MSGEAVIWLLYFFTEEPDVKEEEAKMITEIEKRDGRKIPLDTDLICKKTPANEEWRSKKYAFFSHSECEAFPCHATDAKEHFNCLFCYCPLYFLGEECGGNLSYLPNGVKDCSHCDIPHERESYGYIIDRLVHKMNTVHAESMADVYI